MCGIFGASIKKGKKINLQKVNMLGIYNIQRGTDSCGYYYSGHIEKGIGSKANYGDFITIEALKRGTFENDIFIGHTRKSSSGTISLDNAHPFQVNNFVQVHNGTLRNHWALCDKYKVNHSKIHVDSLALATCIEQEGFEVLEHYEGAAALAMTSMDEPDVLYLYHGAQRDLKGGTLFEERPMYVLEQYEGLYFSSLESSLNFINTNPSKYEVQELPYNEVFRIKNGLLENDRSVKIDREDKKIIVHKPLYPPATVNHQRPKHLTQSKLADIIPLHNMISFEANPIRSKKQNELYFWKGRHYVNGALCHGALIVDRDGMMLKPGETSTKVNEPLYFHKGVLLISACYNTTYADNIAKMKEEGKAPTNFAKHISNYSRYPVYNMISEHDKLDKDDLHVWYKDGVPANQSFLPRFTKYTFRFVKGYLRTFLIEKAETQLPFTENERFSDIEVIGDDNKAFTVIRFFLDKIFKKDEVNVIPEVYLMYIDHILNIYLVDYLNDSLSEELIKNFSKLFVKEMIDREETLRSAMTALGVQSLINDHDFRNALIHADIPSIITEPNRFTISSDKIDFEDKDTFWDYLDLYQDEKEEVERMLMNKSMNKRVLDEDIAQETALRNPEFDDYEDIGYNPNTLSDAEIDQQMDDAYDKLEKARDADFDNESSKDKYGIFRKSKFQKKLDRAAERAQREETNNFIRSSVNFNK